MERERERRDGKSGKPVLVMDTLLDHSSEEGQTAENDVSQPSAVLDPHVYHPPDAFLDTSLAEGETEWDFWDNAGWTWITETICYDPSPMEDEMLHGQPSWTPAPVRR